MNQEELNSFKENLKTLMRNRQKKKVIKNLFIIRREALNSNSGINIKDFYDSIGELVNASPQFFMDKFYKSFNSRMSYNLSLDELFEMEKYILEKFSFLNEEKFLKWFKGRIIQKDTQVTGRLYLTNYRIIAHGKFGPTALSSFGAAAAGSGTNLGSAQASSNMGVAMSINASIQKYLQKQLQQAMTQISEVPKPCFGYQYPIMESFNIYKTKKLVKYWVKIEYQKRNKIKRKTLKIKVIPKKTYLESKSDFNNRKNLILPMIMKQLRTFQI